MEADNKIEQAIQLLEQNGYTVKKKRGHRYSAEFEKFWAIYPAKVGKKAAHQAWQKALEDVSNQTLIDAVQSQIEDRERAKHINKKRDIRNQLFIPPWKHPSTWLNQACWEDEQQIAPPPKQSSQGEQEAHTPRTPASDEMYDATGKIRKISDVKYEEWKKHNKDLYEEQLKIARAQYSKFPGSASTQENIAQGAVKNWWKENIYKPNNSNEF